MTREIRAAAGGADLQIYNWTGQTAIDIAEENAEKAKDKNAAPTPQPSPRCRRALHFLNRRPRLIRRSRSASFIGRRRRRSRHAGEHHGFHGRGN
jgi:hypothetical protein